MRAEEKTYALPFLHESPRVSERESRKKNFSHIVWKSEWKKSMILWKVCSGGLDRPFRSGLNEMHDKMIKHENISPVAWLLELTLRESFSLPTTCPDIPDWRAIFAMGISSARDNNQFILDKYTIENWLPENWSWICASFRLLSVWLFSGKFGGYSGALNLHNWMVCSPPPCPVPREASIIWWSF